MNSVVIVQTLLQRLPPVFIAAFIAAIVTRVYLQFLKEPGLRSFLSDKLWGSLIVFVLVTRFSGLILHPSILVRPNFYTLFGASAASGVAVGVFAVIVYLLVSMRQENHLQRAMWIVRMSLVVSMVFYLYQSFLDMQPFWAEDMLRLVLSFLILVTLHTKLTFHFGHRVWGVLAGFWLLTSLIVPHVNRIGPLDLGQWIAVVILLAAVGLESLKDFREPTHNPATQTSDRLSQDKKE